jgi:hypothetical protein
MDTITAMRFHTMQEHVRRSVCGTPVSLKLLTPTGLIKYVTEKNKSALNEHSPYCLIVYVQTHLYIPHNTFQDWNNLHIFCTIIEFESINKHTHFQYGAQYKHTHGKLINYTGLN